MAIFGYWIPLAVAITLICALVYGAVQQNYRQSANDPQIQIAEDTASLLSNGQDPQNLVAANKVDIAKSLATYVIIFNDNGQTVVSSAELDGQVIPAVPGGVFDFVRSHTEDRFTWQPREDARSAVVVTRYSANQSGFVLVGRSLREVEKREEKLVLEVGLAWAATLFSTFAAATFLTLILPISTRHNSKKS